MESLDTGIVWGIVEFSCHPFCWGGLGKAGEALQDGGRESENVLVTIISLCRGQELEYIELCISCSRCLQRLEIIYSELTSYFEHISQHVMLRR